MSEPSNAAEVTKLDQRISKTTLQEENNIKESVTTLSSKLQLEFHRRSIKIWVDSVGVMGLAHLF